MADDPKDGQDAGAAAPDPAPEAAAAPAKSDAKAAKADPKAAAAPSAQADAATPTSSILEQILSDGKLVRDQKDTKQNARAKDLVSEFVNQVVSGAAGSTDTVKMIANQIAALDAKIGAQLDEIMHAPEFRKLESTWRGLHYLVGKTETSTRLKLRLLAVSKDELAKDLDLDEASFDQSALFKKVYEEEYGTFGGYPFSLLIGDYEFGRIDPDIKLLRNLAGIAASAHAPFIAASSPKMFDMDHFTELANPRDLAKGFESTELAAWNSFRESEDSRYVTLTMPHFLLRLPYGEKTSPVDGFAYEEKINGVHDNYIWGNAAYALGQRITNAFALYGWCAAIRGTEGGGVVSNLPLHTFKTDEGLVAAKCPVEIAITDRREKELDNLGFIALCYRKGTDYAVFFGGQTTQKPATYDTNAANANALISARLPYILAASRFAHYLKVMCRDKIGSFQTKETLTTYLNRWIGGYILGTDDAGQDLKAQYPLREARVDVFDMPGKPGAFRAIAFLRPHFQLEELTTSIRLVAELPPPAAA
jgi:type VI secretion system protein ImpC